MIYKIWEKDDFFQIGGKRIDMDPIVVRCNEEPLPLVWGYDWTKGPIGWCSDIRIENEEILCELEWADEHIIKVAATMNPLKAFHARLGGYYQPVVYANEEQTVLKSALLRGVSMVLKESMPGFPKEAL